MPAHSSLNIWGKDSKAKQFIDQTVKFESKLLTLMSLLFASTLILEQLGNVRRERQIS